MTDAAAPFARYTPAPEVRAPRLTPVLTEAGTDTVDLLAALQVRVRGGSPAQWAESISRTLHGERSTVVVAYPDRGSCGPEPVGYANVAHLPEHPDDRAPAGYYLTGVTVSPEWRRRGLGAALTRWRMAWAWDRAPEVWCFVSARNEASLDLHRGLGFEAVRSAAALQGVRFDGGAGRLLRALPTDPRVQRPEGA